MSEDPTNNPETNRTYSNKDLINYRGVKEFNSKFENKNISKILRSADLESRKVNNRLDSNIGSVYRQILSNENNLLRSLEGRTLEPRVARSAISPSSVFNSRFGLQAMSMGWRLEDTLLTTGGQPVLKDGQGYTQVDFMPGGRGNMVAEKITDSIASGIRGLTELIDGIDSGRLDLEPVFMGKTNINIAIILQRLGFKIVDSDRNQDGSIDKTKKNFRVVGHLDDIKKKMAEFAQTGVQDRILKRANRLPQTS